MTVANDQFLQAIFGENYPYAHVTSFTQDPSNIPAGESGRCWAGSYFKDSQLIPNSNQFYTVSLFNLDEQGKANRRKANFSACHVIALDDVKEKLPLEQVMRLPAPSIVLKSSLHSEQWLYLLRTPCADATKVDNLHDGLIANGLAPTGKDPGQKGITRYLRLPEGCNTKAKRIAENGGIAPSCDVTEWHPERRYTLEQLAEPFGVDLNAPRAEKRVDGATKLPDHPLVHTDAIHIKSILSDGRYDVTCPWIDEHSDADDSGTAVFTNSDGTIGFKCHHGNCVDRTAGDLLGFIEHQDAGFNERYKQWKIVRDFSDIKADLLDAPPPNDSPLESLFACAANGDSGKLKQQMANDRYILKHLAILGQWTVFFAAPNVGKTLLIQWLLRETRTSAKLNDIHIIYANCDDTLKGGTEKLQIAETSDYLMLLPNHKGFKTESLLTTISAITDRGEANGVVIIMDTVKKFTDVMDKRISTQFGVVARSFVSAGGTLICLAHVNKHTDSNGKSIPAGTSDLRDDCDCCYTIELVGNTEGFCSTTRTVEFECIKSRGDVVQKEVFEYTKEEGAGYQALFDSVKRVDPKAADTVRKAEREVEQRQKDKYVIEQIKTAITNDQRTKGNIEEFVTTTSDSPHRKVRSVLKKYEGELWIAEKGPNNSSLYTLKSTSIGMEEVSFF